MLEAGTGRMMPSAFTSIPYFPGFSVSNEESTLSSSPNVDAPPADAGSSINAADITGELPSTSSSMLSPIMSVSGPSSIMAEDKAERSCRWLRDDFTVIPLAKVIYPSALSATSFLKNLSYTGLSSSTSCALSA